MHGVRTNRAKQETKNDLDRIYEAPPTSASLSRPSIQSFLTISIGIIIPAIATAPAETQPITVELAPSAGLMLLSIATKSGLLLMVMVSCAARAVKKMMTIKPKNPIAFTFCG